MKPSDMFAALAAHDDLVARRSIDVWIGGEPTFTRADSLEAAWTTAAEGDDKLERALGLANELAGALPGASVSRVVGRTYPDEKAPRFAFGVRWRDDGEGEALRVTLEVEPAPPPAELGEERWLSVTPDPGVVEVNMAPCATTAAFYAQAEGVWEAAREVGLAPMRPRFNGDLADSGGGGQITIGGARPEISPFVRYPSLLPSLIRYLNNHPSLSYWFANECVGAASQGPRPDEGTRERYDELEITLRFLEALADRGELAPEQLWHALGPLLVDGAGNSHRAEINVEKLWNPHVAIHGPRHGKMGVVELRAIRMPERPSMFAALAALLRSIVARLVVDDYREPLIDWHDDLHDRFALPAALQRDLRFVLGDLDAHGLGLAAQIRGELETWRSAGITCRLGDAVLSLRPALEFWPLVGDVASQELSTSRVVDASTQRWELAFEGPGPERIAIAGKWATPRPLADGVRILGVRRRIFQPSPGFHP
ncbi:MAG TPA: transglutaminase family protein, partial [Kofleriaceae bacterium]